MWPHPSEAMASELNFLTETTPNPAEVSIMVKVDGNQLNPTSIPTLGLPYKQIDKSITNPRVNECGFGDYVYTFMSGGGADIWLHFGKPKTTVEKNTPFRVSYSTRYYPWPPVLELLKLVKTTQFPQSVFNGTTTVTAPRFFPRYKYRPTPSVNSVIKIEQFLAPTPFDGQALIHPQPIPTEISGHYLGMSISFPRCLHPLVVLDENVPGATVVEGQGTINVPVTGSINRQVFPATNFIDWAPFILEDQCQPSGGLYLRERITIYPPFRPISIEN